MLTGANDCSKPTLVRFVLSPVGLTRMRSNYHLEWNNRTARVALLSSVSHRMPEADKLISIPWAVVVFPFSTGGRTTTKPISGRRKTNQKILRFSLLIGAGVASLTLLIYVSSFYPDLRRWSAANSQALSEINCEDSRCNISQFLQDWHSESPDYVVDTVTRYVIVSSTATKPKPISCIWLRGSNFCGEISSAKFVPNA
jgi:hypothetical protein